MANWILYLVVAVAIAGVVLAALFSLVPCPTEDVFTMGNMDCILVVDNSGSVSDSQFVELREGSQAFLEALNNAFTGQRFRAGLIDYGATAQVVYHIANYTAEDLIELMPDTPRSMRGSTATDIALDAAYSMFDKHSLFGQFRLVILLSDGASNNALNTARAASQLKMSNATIVGMIIGTTDSYTRELYSMTSCTPADFVDGTVPVGSMDPNCTYFAAATDFSLIEENAIRLANALDIPVTVNSICIEANQLLWLLLLIPLLTYFLLAPLAHYLRKTCCPPPAPAAVPASGGSGAVNGKQQKDANGKWKTVNAGGYLWSMNGAGTGIVEVNFGDKAPPSAPGAVLKNQPNPVLNEMEEIYGGGSTQLWLSRYLCCLCWVCLSEEDKAELNGATNDGYQPMSNA